MTFPQMRKIFSLIIERESSMEVAVLKTRRPTSLLGTNRRQIE